MRLRYLPFLCILGTANAAPSNTTAQINQRQVDVTAIVKNNWASVANAYRRFDRALQELRPGQGSIGRSDVPAAHNNIINVLTVTADSIRGLKPVSITEAMFQLTPAAQSLLQTEVAAINTAIRTKSLVVQSGERAQFQRALIDQNEYHNWWSATFRTLIPTSPQQSFAQGLTDQVQDSYQRAIGIYAYD
jgi:hypothetical protein